MDFVQLMREFFLSLTNSESYFMSYPYLYPQRLSP